MTDLLRSHDYLRAILLLAGKRIREINRDLNREVHRFQRVDDLAPLETCINCRID